MVWSAQERGQWQLRGRRFRDGDTRSIETLTATAGPNLHHKITADRQGRLWLVWQGFERGQSDIFLSVFDGGSWGPRLQISESAANDWEPSIAVDSQGRAWIASRVGNGRRGSRTGSSGPRHCSQIATGAAS